MDARCDDGKPLENSFRHLNHTLLQRLILNMDCKKILIQRLTVANPGWEEWDVLIDLIEQLDFEYITSEYLGSHYVSEDRLCFAESSESQIWPDWLPAYVQALYGMKADEWEMAGGYACIFDNEPAQKGSVFAAGEDDTQLGYPILEVPSDLYPFQTNAHGAIFFINKSLDIFYPSAETERFMKMDSLDDFTRKNIRQALIAETWFTAYRNLDPDLFS